MQDLINKISAMDMLVFFVTWFTITIIMSVLKDKTKLEVVVRFAFTLFMNMIALVIYISVKY